MTEIDWTVTLGMYLERVAEKERWQTPAIKRTYPSPYRSNRLFSSVKELEAYTTLGNGFESDVTAFSLPRGNGAVGCIVYSRQSKKFPGDPKFFAYKEHGKSLIYAAIPRIVIDETTVSYRSQRALLYHRPRRITVTAQMYFGLTDRQEKILRFALENGYYNHKRDISLTGLAERVGANVSTVQRTLARAEKKVLSALFAE